MHRHKHVKTKYVHVYHPKAFHTDHSSVQFLHRHDPNIGLVNGGYPQPLINLNHHKPELRITEEEFLKWRQDQVRKALEQRKRFQEEQQKSIDADEDYEEAQDEPEEEKYEDDGYKKHKAQTSSYNSSSAWKDSSRYGNHNENEYETPIVGNTFENYQSSSNYKRKSKRPPQAYRPSVDRPRKNHNYGHFNPDVEASNIQPQYYDLDQMFTDPKHYTTIPKDQEAEASDHQDDIYSGLLSAQYNKNIEDKSRRLGDINYNRKQQTKIFTQRNKSQ